MAQRKPELVPPQTSPQQATAVPLGVARVLPAKAEAALREVGLWNEQFVRQLANLDRVTLDALSVLGAWDDLNWDDMAASFARMRHESPPSPSIEL